MREGFNNVDDESFISDDEEMCEEEEDEDCPTIRLSKVEKARLRSPWRQTLIVKVLGRTVGYTYLLRRIKALWHPKSHIDLVAMDNDYFLVKFASKDDYNFAKYEGPWMVMDHYLIVKEWSPNFDPMIDSTERVLVWVRFPCLQIEYYDQDFLMKVGEKIGKPIRIDQTTGLVSRGKFARLCVEVDITKPLLSKFKLRRRVRRIEYEGIHLVCFHCGVYGHRKDNCPMLGQSFVLEERTEKGDNGDIPAVDTNGEEKGQIREEIINPEIMENFGPWMLAARKFRRSDRKWNGRENHATSYDKRKDIRRDSDLLRKFRGKSSNFEVLQMLSSQDGINDSNGPEAEENILGHNGLDLTLVGKLGGRGRMPNVQISEKEVRYAQTNVDLAQSIRSENEHNFEKRREQMLNLRKSKQAAAEAEHIVVRSSQNGKSVVRKVVNNISNDEGMENMTLFSKEVQEEHHQDPPNSSIRVGDVALMVIEDVRDGGGTGDCPKRDQ